MKTPRQSGVVIKIENPFHTPCLRRIKGRGKHVLGKLQCLIVVWKTAKPPVFA